MTAYLLAGLTHSPVVTWAAVVVAVIAVVAVVAWSRRGSLTGRCERGWTMTGSDPAKVAFLILSDDPDRALPGTHHRRPGSCRRAVGLGGRPGAGARWRCARW